MTVKYTTILTYRGDKSLQSIKEKNLWFIIIKIILLISIIYDLVVNFSMWRFNDHVLLIWKKVM